MRFQANGATLQYSSTAAQTLSGAITGQGGLTADTSGTPSSLTLTGTVNTYSGTTAISNAIRIAAGPTNLSPNTAFNIVGTSSGGGQLFFNAGTATVANNFTISGVGFVDAFGFAGAIRMSNNLTFTGTITLAGDARIGFIGSSVTNNFNGQITGSNGVEFASVALANSTSGTFSLGNTGTANNYTGNTAITSLDYSATPTSTYTGNTEIDSGAIRVDAAPGNATSAYYVGNGTTTTTAGSLLLGGAGGTGGGVTLSNLIAINPGSGNNRTLGGTNTTGTTNTFAGTTYSNGGSLTVTSTNAGATLAFTNVQSIDLKSANALFNGAGNTTVSGALYNSTGSGSVTKEGTGMLTLSGANTYTGNTTVNAGVLTLAGGAELKFVLGASSGSSNSITGTGTVNLNGGFVIDTTAANSLSSGTWTLVDAATLTETFSGTFTIIGAEWSQTADVWTKTVGSKQYTFTEATGILTLASAAGYSTWAAINAPGSAPGLDYDGDGVTNAVEYILGGDKDTNDLSKLPTVDASGSDLVFTFQRAQSSIDGTTVAIQVGTTLAAWPDSYSVPETALANNPGVTVQKNFPASGTDTVTLRVVKAPDAAKFARLVVTPAP